MDLTEECEQFEHKLLHKAVNCMSREEQVHATWDIEGAAILAWALRRFELPIHDQQVNPFDVAESMSFLEPTALNLIGSATLRPIIELQAYREMIYATHSRLRAYIRCNVPKNFTTSIDKSCLQTLGIAESTIIGNLDLAINQRDIASASIADIQFVEWVTCQRHKAILWLLEVGGLYSRVQVDT